MSYSARYAAFNESIFRTRDEDIPIQHCTTNKILYLYSVAPIGVQCCRRMPVSAVGMPVSAVGEPVWPTETTVVYMSANSAFYYGMLHSISE